MAPARVSPGGAALARGRGRPLADRRARAAEAPPAAEARAKAAPSRYAPVLLHAPVVFLAAVSWWLWEDAVLTLRVGGALVLVVFPILAWMEAKRSPLLLAPLSFYFLWYATGLGASAFYIADKLTHYRVLEFSVTYLLRDDLARGYLIFLTGGLALHAAMQIVRPMPGEVETPDARRTPAGRLFASHGGLFAIWAVGVAVRVSGDVAAVVGAFGPVLGTGSLAALCVLALRTEPQRRDALYWLALVLGVAIEFTINIRWGSKAFLMYSFIPIVWVLVWDPRLRRWLLPLGAALGIFYLTVLSPVVSASRLGMRESDSRGDRIVSTFVEGTYKSQSVTDNVTAFLDRQFDPMPIAFIVREVDHRGLLDGASLDYLAYAFIPRIVWPDKPAVTRGRWFNLYLLGDDRGSTTNVGQTAVGELYWNFGMLGVVLGMAAIGALIAGLWRLFGTTPHRDPIAMIGYVSVIFGMNNLTEAGTVVVTITFTGLFFMSLLFLTRIFGAPRKRLRVGAG